MVKARLTFVVLIAASAGAIVAHGAEEPYPNKSIRLILPIAPGGGMDMVARGLGQKLGDNLGQTIVIDNRAGGGGSIGVELAAHAAPNGYTLIMISSSAVIYQLLYRARYDLLRDFSPISQVTAQPYLMVVNPSLPIRSVTELIAFAKSNPGKLNYASSGNGSLTNLTGELFKAATAVQIIHVPYKTINAAFPDLFAGSIHMAFQSIVSVQAHIKANRLRPVAVTSSQRAKSMPEVPTVAESGVEGFAVTQWFGAVAPARTPRHIVERLHQGIVKVLQQPEVASRFETDGAEVVGSSPQQLAAHIKAERDKWEKVIKETGIRAD